MLAKAAVGYQLVPGCTQVLPTAALGLLSLLLLSAQGTLLSSSGVSVWGKVHAAILSVPNVISISLSIGSLHFPLLSPCYLSPLKQ